MRQTIIEMLRTSGRNFVSGEAIAETLGISRAAVWKHIQKLRHKGYAIDSRERCGYRFTDAPDLLFDADIKNGLDTQIIGHDVFYLPTTDSTNREAKKLAYNAAPDGMIVVAEEQTGGKGRLNRTFFSPRGKGLWFSIILRPRFLPTDAPKCTLMAAVAIANAMKLFDLKAQIKWPNDIMYDGRKLVGILTELSAEMSKINYVIIGIGINVNIDRKDFPPELRDIAASLSEIKGAPISRLNLIRAILEEFDKLYVMITNDPKGGFAKILDDWRHYSITLGKNVRVFSVSTDEYFVGYAVDIDRDGALLVETPNGIERVFAGDVSIRDDV